MPCFALENAICCSCDKPGVSAPGTTPQPSAKTASTSPCLGCGERTSVRSQDRRRPPKGSIDIAQRHRRPRQATWKPSVVRPLQVASLALGGGGRPSDRAGSQRRARGAANRSPELADQLEADHDAAARLSGSREDFPLITKVITVPGLSLPESAPRMRTAAMPRLITRMHRMTPAGAPLNLLAVFMAARQCDICSGVVKGPERGHADHAHSGRGVRTGVWRGLVSTRPAPPPIWRSQGTG